MISGEFWLGLGVGIGLAALAFAGLYLGFRRRVRQRELALSSVAGALPPPTLHSTAGPTVLHGRPAPENPPSVAFVTAESESIESTMPIFSSVLVEGPTPRSNNGESGRVRLSQRVLIHLARRSGSLAGGSVDESFTQRGISAALTVTQGALSSVLKRLEDGGAIISERSHVRGRDRRVKVYVLTPRGRELVVTIRRQAMTRTEFPPRTPPRSNRGPPIG